MKPNSSVSQSVQLIQKIKGMYKVLKTIGSATTQQVIERLVSLAKQEIKSNTISAELHGTRAYDVEIYLDNEKVHGTCSCEYYDVCKHIIAYCLILPKIVLRILWKMI
jgi:hypothetical protein